MKRRRFLKYAVVGTALAGSALVSYELGRWQTPLAPLCVSTRTITESVKGATSTHTVTKTTTATQTAKPKVKEGYSLLGNYDHWHWSIKPDEVEQFARWDLLALNFETAHSAVAALKEIRNLNPKIRILAWISLGFYKPEGWGGYLDTKLLGASNEDWWIHRQGTGPPSTRRVEFASYYPGLVAPNPRSAFAEHVVRFMHDEVLSTGLYDGIFYDVCIDDQGWLGALLADAEISVTEYRQGVANILRATRENEGANAIIMGNPGVWWEEASAYWEYANGHYQENALGDVFGNDWGKMWEIYQRNMRKKPPPERLHWIGVDTQYKRKRDDYSKVSRSDLTSDDLRRMRLGLGTTLLLDRGYFGFDRGDGWHGYGEQWWFPEYDANLGMPKGNYEKASDGTYRRQYDNAVVIVNPGPNKLIDLDARYRDATTNEMVKQIAIPSEDARILVEV